MRFWRRRGFFSAAAARLRVAAGKDVMVGTEVLVPVPEKATAL
jgi:hypothetical protein